MKSQEVIKGGIRTRAMENLNVATALLAMNVHVHRWPKQNNI